MRAVLRRRALAVAVLLAGAVPMAGCASDDGAVLRVRTHLPPELRTEVATGFEASHPGVVVRFSDEPVQASLSQLLGGDPGFDVWWGAPAVALVGAEAEGRVAEWRPVLTTPLVLAFDRTQVALGDAPADWIDVFHHAWYDDVRVPDPAATDAGAWLVGGMIVEALRDDDLNRGFDWLARLHGQVDAYMTDSHAMVRALRSGDALLAVLPRADAEQARSGDAPWLHYRIPASGTPELMLGAAVVEGTDRLNLARAFLDHLTTPEVATAAKLATHWDPVGASVVEDRVPSDFELAQSWRGFTPALDTLAAELDGWIDRWEREVRVR